MASTGATGVPDPGQETTSAGQPGLFSQFQAPTPEPVPGTAPQQPTQESVNGRMLDAIKLYTESGYQDEKLLKEFQHHFSYYNKQRFDLASKPVVKEFREFLISHGIWMSPRKGVSHTEQLADVVKWDSLHEWSAEDLARYEGKQDLQTRFSPNNKSYNKAAEAERAIQQRRVLWAETERAKAEFELKAIELQELQDLIAMKRQSREDAAAARASATAPEDDMRRLLVGGREVVKLPGQVAFLGKEKKGKGNQPEADEDVATEDLVDKKAMEVIEDNAKEPDKDKQEDNKDLEGDNKPGFLYRHDGDGDDGDDDDDDDGDNDNDEDDDGNGGRGWIGSRRRRGGDDDGGGIGGNGGGGGGGNPGYPGYSASPPYDPNRPQSKSKQMEALTKLYRDSDRYRGPEDSLDDKLGIFWGMCTMADVQTETYADALIIMLIGKARTTYIEAFLNYKRKDASRYGVDDRIEYLRQRFETAQWRTEKEAKWHLWTLDKMIENNPKRALKDNYAAFEDGARQLQKGVPSIEGDAALRGKIMSAILATPDLRRVLVEPALSAEGVCAQVRTELAIVGYRSPSQSYHQHDHINGTEQAYLTERIYNRSGPQARSGRGGGAGFRPNNRGETKGGARGGFKNSTQWKKRCFVCGKEDCWSTNHSKEEMDEAMRKRRAARPGVNITKAYVTFYEGEDPNEAFILQFEEAWAAEQSEDWPEWDDYIDVQKQHLLEDVNEDAFIQHLCEQRESHAFTAPRLA